MTFVEEIYILLEILTPLAIAYTRANDGASCRARGKLVVNVWTEIMAKRNLDAEVDDFEDVRIF